MNQLDQAINIFRQGGIVIFPTDTAFGIGCRIDRPKSVKRLFQIRKRPETKATPVLVDSIEMAETYYRSPILNNVRHIMQSYWPGALTIVYYCKYDMVTPLVLGGGETIGFRMPDHEIPLTLISGVGVPILGPSANFHRYPTPFSYNDLDKDLVKLVDYVVEGECKTRNVSTVVDCTKTPFTILRQGAIHIDLSHDTVK